MDSKAILDYALFQLTPTRTRCDLLVFCGKKSEKLASGLVEPFISHLKYAKDHIPKGGYSITLRSPATGDASWFTKATFQRFVRFVSTPEILERIIRIEQELLQIESSTQSGDLGDGEETGHPGEGSSSVSDGIVKNSTNSLKAPEEEEDHEAEQMENSKVRLQRLMDTRKALLRKDQAMAYARAVVAGYEMDIIDDLICFADVFGASRLRAACIDFKELYNKKQSDDQWLDELAAVQACSVADLSYMGTSGIMLAGDNGGAFLRTSSEPSDLTATPTNSDGSKVTADNVQQVPWMNQIPPYMYNFPGPGQQMATYQGFPFPGMHPSVQPYYQGHMGWSPPGDVRQSKSRSSRRKAKSVDGKGTDASDEDDEQTESTDSDMGANSDGVEERDKKSSSKSQKHIKKSKKNGSKTVVIRNINYITSQRRNGEEEEASDDSSGEASSLDGASIREGIDNAIASLEKRSRAKGRKNRGKHGQNGLDGSAEPDLRNGTDISGVKTADTWGAFQNLLLSHEESNSRDLPKHSEDSMDGHLVMKSSNGGLSHNTSSTMDFESEKVKVRSLTLDDSVLVVQRVEDNGGKTGIVDFANGEDGRSSTRKLISEYSDALFAKQVNESRNGALPDFSSELSTIKNPKGDDWFIVNSSGGSEIQKGKQMGFANHDSLSYDMDFVQKETAKATAVIDDSFIIESRSTVDESYASQWRTDINMDADMDATAQHVSPTVGKSSTAQPDDLCMVLVRESQDTGASWTPEMDYQVEISFNETDKSPSTVKPNSQAQDSLANGKNANSKKNAGPATKTMGRDARSRSLVKNRIDPFSKTKKTFSPNRPMVHKSKLEKEEEERKRMEELVIQRQKRIAERTSAAGGLTSTMKKLPVGSKSAPSKLEKSKPSARNG